MNRWDVAKLIALLLMFVDHAGVFYFPNEEWLRGIGRGAAPVFMFLTGLAAHYRFSRELLVLAVVLSVFEFWYYGGPHALNILWVILACRLLLAWMEKRKIVIKRPHEWLIACVLFTPTLLISQTGTLGLLMAMSGYMMKHESKHKHAARWLAIILFTYGICVILISELGMGAVFWTLVSLEVVYKLLRWVAEKPKAITNAPVMLRPFARYSGYVYVGHLIVLMLLSKLN